jgi:HTH-type transcriptional regulator/antitoxin HigA
MSRAQLAIDYVDQKTHHKFHLPIKVFQKPRNSREYNQLEKLLDQLIDEVKNNERHPLVPAMQIIGDNLELYDSENHPPIGKGISDIEMVKYLMKAHNLYQKDLAEIFSSQANVSKFLNGERELSKKQIEGLKQKFFISADFFIRPVN